MALKDKKFFLLDMDGTIYLDDELFVGTVEFLELIKEKGGKYLFVTNNSSKGLEAYIEKMKRLGIEASKDDFLTSVDATIAYIRKYHNDKRFYCMGTKSFVSTLLEEGIDIVTEIGEGIDGILLGYDTELTYKKIDDVCRLLSTGDYIYIATNPDITCPTSYGFVPDLGSISVMIKNATGKMPHFIGKPEPDIYLKACYELGVDPKNAIGLEDSYNGVRAIFSAGMKAIMIPDMVEPDDEMYSKTYAIKNSLLDVIDVIDNIK